MKLETTEENVKCPKCKSSQVTGQRQGFGFGKAIVGGVLTGGVGLLAGTIGSSNIKVSCLKCGLTWKAQNWAAEERLARKEERQKEAFEGFIEGAFVNFLMRWFGWTFGIASAAALILEGQDITALSPMVGKIVLAAIITASFAITAWKPFGSKEEISPRGNLGTWSSVSYDENK